MNNNQIFSHEKRHLLQCKNAIQENIKKYSDKVLEVSEETKDTYTGYQSGDSGIYGDLLVSYHLKDIYTELLRKNEAALNKPYFARIDFREDDPAAGSQQMSVYIGKKGIMRDGKYPEVIDWRTPVAAVYYENEKGKGSYSPNTESTLSGQIPIELSLKRTFDIGKEGLLGFYDGDAVSNDELLIKYLSHNKASGLEDIIATIQKEQSEIIRLSPFHNLIVQGVAGSGKTTVIIHRISYILYNYSKFFEASQFCIVGSNQILLQYIVSGLPEVDVYHVKYKRMDELLIDLTGNEWKKSYQLKKTEHQNTWKSKMCFILELERYLITLKNRKVPTEIINDMQLGVLIKCESIRNLAEYQKTSVNRLLEILEERLKYRLGTELSRYNSEKIRAEKKKKYRKYFEKYKIRTKAADIYESFLTVYAEAYDMDLESQIEDIRKRNFDIYDINAMVLIYFHTKQTKNNDEFSQLLIDEGQEYGSAIYYVLKSVLKDCHFTVVGDVCQNLNPETGFNSWKDLQSKIFPSDTDEFKVLNKSYRNTIEISEYAGNLLNSREKSEYHMEPVIRHGEKVKTVQTISNEEAAGVVWDMISRWKEKDYQTIGILCFHESQVEWIGRQADDHQRESEQQEFSIDSQNEHEQQRFQDGINILTIPMAKGLEFDAVIIVKHGVWELSEKQKMKYLYVAATRALHELCVVE